MSELPVHIGDDDAHAHPHHTGHRWFDITMALCANNGVPAIKAPAAAPPRS